MPQNGHGSVGQLLRRDAVEGSRHIEKAGPKPRNGGAGPGGYRPATYSGTGPWFRAIGLKANAPVRWAQRETRAHFSAGHDEHGIYYFGHKNIQHTVRYTEMAPDRFKNFWRD